MLTSAKDFFQLSPIPIWVVEAVTHKFLDVNIAAIEFYGYSKEEFLNLDLTEVDEGEVMTNLGKTIKLHRNKEGEIIYCHLSIQSIVFEGVNAQLVLISDFTGSVASERRMEESAERFNIVSKATSDTIWDLSLDTEVMVWNKGIKGIFGHKDIINNTTAISWWHQCIHPEDRDRMLAKINSHLVSGINRWKDEYRFKCGDGTYRHVQDRGFLVFDKTGKPIRMIGAMEDVTERKLYIQAIEEQNKKFKEIAWIQSHMVRAPLARIMALVDLINIEPTDTDYQKMLGYLSSSAKELDTVIINMAYQSPQT